MNRGYNFGAGPAMLPEELLVEIKEELLNWQDSGMSIMEIGHRTPEFSALMEETEVLLRELLQIPNNYYVFFIGGAARTQFGMIPLNFLNEKQKAGYLITGIWSQMAFEEASRLRAAYTVMSAGPDFISIPSTNWQLQEDSTYIYYTPNETVNGLRFNGLPSFSSPQSLIADMTSCLLSEPINVTNFSLLFAGAQKNIANAGLTLVIVREDLVNKISNEQLATMGDYRTYASTRSMYATPPTFNCYLALKMFQWVKKQGGVAHFYKLNCQKAKLLYDYIDSSSVYYCPIKAENRSIVNACFRTKNSKLEPIFLEEAKKNGLLALAGHRLVGGLRASMYNSMPLAGVEKLVNFMDDFAKEYGHECN